jgi:hypothetical protein
VYYGLHNNIIQSRVSPYTYGIAVRKDGEGEMFSVMVSAFVSATLGMWFIGICVALGLWFVRFLNKRRAVTLLPALCFLYPLVQVKKGEELPFNHEISKSGVPADASQRALTWRIYRSDKDAPTTVTGEHRLGRLVVDCPPDAVRTNRRQKGVFCFGGSEIRVTIVNA